MRHLRLIVAYDGTAYSGWQFQINGPSIQECMEKAWKKITGEQLRVIASGRTDAGVHARGQVCSLTTGSDLDCATLARALSATLPEDIAVSQVIPAPDGFHAIRDAICKTYRYRIVTGLFRDVLDRRQSWYVPTWLDVSAMRAAARHLVGKHDFASFQAAGSVRKTTIRNVLGITVAERELDGRQYLDFDIMADGFLYNMVRIIAGTLVHVGQGRREPEWVAEAIRAQDRNSAGPTAPAQGLCLMSVCYEGWCNCGAGECPGKSLLIPGKAAHAHPDNDDDFCGDVPIET